MVSKDVNLVFTIILVFTLLVSCKQKEPDILAETTYLLPVLSDMYYMQIAVEQAPESIRDSLAAIYKEQILKIHEIDEKELTRIQNLLLKDTEKTAQLYDTLFLYMNKLENEYLDLGKTEVENEDGQNSEL